MNVTDVQMDGQTPRYADRRTAINDRRSQKLTSLQSWRMFRTDDAGARQLMSGAAWIQCNAGVMCYFTGDSPASSDRQVETTHTPNSESVLQPYRLAPKREATFLLLTCSKRYNNVAWFPLIKTTKIVIIIFYLLIHFRSAFVSMTSLPPTKEEINAFPRVCLPVC